MSQSGRRIWSSFRSLLAKSSASESHASVRRTRVKLVTAAASATAASCLLSYPTLVPDVRAASYFTSSPSHEPLVKKPSIVFNFLADVVERTAPAVVRIEIPLINRLGFQYGLSAGSGFIISPDGLILTNAHVVGNSRTCKVILSDNREMEGTVEAIDENTDLATVRIAGKNLPTLPLGSSGTTRPGEFVVALGSPLHLTNSISHGIVSSVNRKLDNLTGGQVSSMPYIQTDAAINVGNSGGPLVNLEGEAIGVNSMKLAEGIAFAIPMDYVKKFLKKIEEQKRISTSRSRTPATTVTPIPISGIDRKGFIGLTMLALNQRVADQIRAVNPDFPPEISSGILVVKVVDGSPAYQSGLQPYDVIVKVNGKEAGCSKVLFDAIGRQEEMVLHVKRGRSKDLTVKILPQEHSVLVFSLEN